MHASSLQNCAVQAWQRSHSRALQPFELHLINDNEVGVPRDNFSYHRQSRRYIVAHVLQLKFCRIL